jgi:hypothetical protein
MVLVVVASSFLALYNSEETVLNFFEETQEPKVNATSVTGINLTFIIMCCFIQYQISK